MTDRGVIAATCTTVKDSCTNLPCISSIVSLTPTGTTVSTVGASAGMSGCDHSEVANV